MNHFTTDDVDETGMYPRIRCLKTDLIRKPLLWQRKGLQETASGYGAKLTSELMIHFNGKVYRIYVTCYSNNGSSWFAVRGRKIYVDAI